MENRKRICISAYACSPYQGSEAGVSWGIILELSKYFKLWVYVEKQKFQGDILKYLTENPELKKDITFIFIEKQRARALRKIWPPSYYYFYRKWQRKVFEDASERHKNLNFDIIHHITMGGFREPGFLYNLPVPFVWGPTGGMGYFPWRFLATLGFQGFGYYIGYNILNFIDMRLKFRVRAAARATARGDVCSFIASTNDNLVGARKNWGIDGTFIPEVGPPDIEHTHPSRRSVNEPLKIVWAGVFQHRKALNIGLRALAALPKSMSWELHVLGSGPLEKKWKELAKNLGLTDRCRFYGQVDRAQVLEVMETSHVLLLTSLRDITSTVLIEGMSVGLPVICLKHCGFADIVDDTNGVAVSVEKPSKTIKEITTALYYLAENENKRLAMGTNAQKVREQFAWRNKVDIIKKIYESHFSD
jgi:glycosyltransferase involved in cell wall biosynthesis